MGGFVNLSFEEASAAATAAAAVTSTTATERANSIDSALGASALA